MQQRECLAVQLDHTTITFYAGIGIGIHLTEQIVCVTIFVSNIFVTLC